MYITLLGITGAVVSAVQFKKVCVIFVTLVALLISGAFTSEVQPVKVEGIFVTPLGITGAVTREVHSRKVPYMFVTLVALLMSGAFTREVHPEKV